MITFGLLIYLFLPVLENAKQMSASELPLYIWVYFGVRQEKRGRDSMYTYGLKDFGKCEIEVLNSKKDLEEINEMLYNIVHYVLAQDVSLQDGETIGLTMTQKLKIKLSKGEYLDEKTLKIDF